MRHPKRLVSGADYLGHSAELQGKLEEAQKEGGIVPGSLDSIGPSSLNPTLQVWQPELNNATDASHHSVSPLPPYSVFPAKAFPSPPSTNGSRPATSSSGVRNGNLLDLTTHSFNPANGAGVSGPSRVFAGNVDVDVSRELQGRATAGGFADDETSSYELIFSGWNADLPEPRLLHHMWVAGGCL